MKWRLWSDRILHFLPFWIFGIGLVSPIVSEIIEWGLTYAPNPKWFYDFQDSFLGQNEMFGICILISFGLSWLWCFLIHFFWRKEDRPTRWGLTLLFLVFPIVACAIISAVLPCSSEKRVEERHRIHCQVKMKQIVIALNCYADNNRDHYPDKLEMLCPDYMSCLTCLAEEEKKMFRCPSAKEHHGFSDYNYYGKGRKSTDPVFLILEDKMENHRGNYKNRAESDGYCTFGKKIE